MKKFLLTSAMGAAVFFAYPAWAQDDGMGDSVFSDGGAAAEAGPGAGDLSDPSTVSPTPNPARKTPAAPAAVKPPPSKISTPRTTGFYFAGALGLNYTADADNTGPGFNVESDYDGGYHFAGALGLRFSEDFRIETEISYRANDVDALTITGANAPGGGDITATSFMLNAYGDMDVFSDNTSMNYIKPYIMGGLGMSQVNADISSGGVQLVDDEDYAFTYQIGVGLGWSFDEATTLDLGYRYLATSDLEFNAANNGPQFDSDYDNHTFLLGVRHEFNSSK